VLIGVLAIEVACGPTPPSTVPDGGAVDAGLVDAGPGDAGTTVKLNEVQASILIFGCAVASCHSAAGASASGNLVLDKEHAYSQLVNAVSNNTVAATAGEVRVKPGNLSRSFLWKKVTGPGAGEGNVMPNTGMHLDQGQLDLLQQWIVGGALCDPYSCADLGQTCGDPGDGCGGTHHCGSACP